MQNKTMIRALHKCNNQVFSNMECPSRTRTNISHELYTYCTVVVFCAISVMLEVLTSSDLFLFANLHAKEGHL